MSLIASFLCSDKCSSRSCLFKRRCPCCDTEGLNDAVAPSNDINLEVHSLLHPSHSNSAVPQIVLVSRSRNECSYKIEGALDVLLVNQMKY